MKSYIHFTFILSFKCKLNCKYCYQRQERLNTNKHKRIESKDFEKILPLIFKKIRDFEEISLVLMGGEYTDIYTKEEFLTILKIFLKYLKKYNIIEKTTLHLSSNGLGNVDYYLEIIEFSKINKLNIIIPITLHYLNNKQLSKFKLTFESLKDKKEFILIKFIEFEKFYKNIDWIKDYKNFNVISINNQCILEKIQTENFICQGSIYELRPDLKIYNQCKNQILTLSEFYKENLFKFIKCPRKTCVCENMFNKILKYKRE